MITPRLVRALDSRLGVRPVARKTLTKVFPDHWSFMLGEIALYSFVVLVLTGVFLTFFFVPSGAETTYRGNYAPLDGAQVSSAFASTVALSFDVPAGLLMRQTHHWAASIFVAAIAAHLIRVFFTGAFRRPREMNWVVGVALLVLVLITSFVGYSISGDLYAGTGLRIAYSVVESVPVIGAWLAYLLFGGEYPNELLVPRLFVAHVLLIPALLVGLISLHMAILIRQRHTQFPGPGHTERNVVGSRLWPGHAARTVALFGYVAGAAVLLGGLVQIDAIWFYGPYDPAQATTPATADWYLAWTDGLLRLFPPLEFRIFGYLVPAQFPPGATLVVAAVALAAWPFLESRLSGDRAPRHLLDRPREHPVRVGVGVAALTALVVLSAGASNDVIARMLNTPVTDVTSFLRILVVTLPWITGAAAYWVARALRDRPESTLGSLSLSELRSARRPSRSGRPGRRDSSDRPGRPDGPGPPEDAHVELWHHADDCWRWRYVAQRGAVSLISTDSYPDRRSAVAAASTAYPGLRVEEVLAPAVVGAAPPGRDRPRGLTGLLGLVALFVVGRRRARRAPREEQREEVRVD
ncbi:ubiquinol-cytochrome c reductase cytochrome b subunit [Micromonospora sp. WMMD1082]|uniref:cytochrome bc1 complex cytochrome b subunit n=1 Tax=Micromonospora sp. WMMD1082 TaxID=3016104 RepID=UPI002417EADC|nr:ubiquinol-cytochrome c reductase cytochrome b subunit [Micromonospora sp. WMMD1082]MDG4798229.1 ubiquinol-cytochrome c reductase cytochrome b subunit [Micromonospora sp. WMMD1082]